MALSQRVTRSEIFIALLISILAVQFNYSYVVFSFANIVSNTYLGLMEVPLNKPKSDIGYQLKRAVARDAYHAGCWVYSVETGKWYTPEDFVQSAERVRMHRNKPEEGQFKVMDPKAGIRTKLDKLNKMQMELEEFTKKVCDYYDFKRKGK